jgi:polyphenol oxidase
VSKVTLSGGVRAVWSDATSGDLRPPSPNRAGNLLRFAGDVTGPGRVVEELHWLEQVHGRGVVVIEAADGRLPVGRVPTGPGQGGTPIRGVADGTGDALVSASSSVALCVLVADCAPVALASPEGVFAAVHAGWRGLADGVVGAAADAMVALGASSIEGALGPCVHPCCYEFSEVDLAGLVEAFGPGVRGLTAAGRPALDLPTAVGAALAAAGVTMADKVDRCTGCGGGLFSHRVRAEPERQVLIVWRGAGAGASADDEDADAADVGADAVER